MQDLCAAANGTGDSLNGCMFPVDLGYNLTANMSLSFLGTYQNLFGACGHDHMYDFWANMAVTSLQANALPLERVAFNDFCVLCSILRLISRLALSRCRLGMHGQRQIVCDGSEIAAHAALLQRSHSRVCA